jgi:hypothetical protein
MCENALDTRRGLEDWREDMAQKLTTDELDELEAHLLDAMDHLPEDLSEEEKFLVATHRLGRSTDLHEEYERVVPWRTWQLPIFWATVGVLWCLAIMMVLMFLATFGVGFARDAGAHPWLVRAIPFVVWLAGPLMTFASVAAWMRSHSTAHPRSETALLVTLSGIALVVTAGALRIVSMRSVVDVGALFGVVLVLGVGAAIVLRFRKLGLRVIS